MRVRLLDLLCCPDCRKELQLLNFAEVDGEITDGVLFCENEHFFPIVGGIPRMLSNSFADHWPSTKEKAPTPLPAALENIITRLDLNSPAVTFDSATKANFSNEWDNHVIGDRTWTMELSDRVEWFFLDPVRIPPGELSGKLLLDAGCGNGSQSVAYTAFGLEVVAVDLSTGLEKGYAYRNKHEGAKPDNVHFVQADLQKPPLKEDSVDIIHSAGVLHHTPDTEKTFRMLSPLLKKDGRFYIWLYKYEKVVTPIVNSMRWVTTRIPAPLFAKIASITAVPFIGFCWTVNKLGIRRYETPSRREAALAVHDIFGAPYAHYHDFDEVSGWFESVGITEYWPCNDDRRGFGVCGRLVNPISKAAAR